MMSNEIDSLSRRLFVQRSLQLGLMGVATPLALNLACIGEAAAFQATDYKALVCVFLYGGNDYANTIVPYDPANYDLYSTIRGGGAGRTRGGIALGRSELAATALTPSAGQVLTNNLQCALAPELVQLKSLFDVGKVAIQLNVGPLIVPLTLAQYSGADRVQYPLPPKLFSHNDQQSVWQSLSSEGATVGWGGRMGDIVLSSNSNAQLTCISATGNAVFVAGQNAVQYQISPSGAIALNALQSPPFGSPAIRDALAAVITQSSNQVLENEYAAVTRRSIQLEGVVNSALTGVNLATSFGTANPLADQLRIVARLIGARNTLGVKRQVFFVSLGGFDNHDRLMVDHPPLMAKLDQALGAFYKATVELGVADQVTAFTASDFGRTLSSNSDGSDHGWGGHHFIVGGAVKGQRYYGVAPQVSVDSDDQVGQGRLLPSTAVDQLAATVARWFGVSASELPSVLPYIGNFANTDLGMF